MLSSATKKNFESTIWTYSVGISKIRRHQEIFQITFLPRHSRSLVILPFSLPVFLTQDMKSDSLGCIKCFCEPGYEEWQASRVHKMFLCLGTLKVEQSQTLYISFKDAPHSLFLGNVPVSSSSVIGNMFPHSLILCTWNSIDGIPFTRNWVQLHLFKYKDNVLYFVSYIVLWL